MNTVGEFPYDPISRMDLVPLPSNLLPVVPMQCGFAEPLIKSDALARMTELQKFLDQCNQPSYVENYSSLLESTPQELLSDFAKQLRERSEWLNNQEQVEMKRAAQVNFLPLGPGLVPVVRLDAAADIYAHHTFLETEPSPFSVMPVAVPECTVTRRTRSSATPTALLSSKGENQQQTTVVEQTSLAEQLLRASATPTDVQPADAAAVPKVAAKRTRATRQSKMKRKERS